MLAKIKQLCKEQNLTVAELERATGIANGVISKWNKASPRADKLKAVADFLGVTVDELLREDS